MAHDHFQTPPDPKRAFTIQFESYFWMFVTENVSMIWNVMVAEDLFSIFKWNELGVWLKWSSDWVIAFACFQISQRLELPHFWRPRWPLTCPGRGNEAKTA